MENANVNIKEMKQFVRKYISDYFNHDGWINWNIKGVDTKVTVSALVKDLAYTQKYVLEGCMKYGSTITIKDINGDEYQIPTRSIVNITDGENVVDDKWRDKMFYIEPAMNVGTQIIVNSYDELGRTHIDVYVKEGYNCWKLEKTFQSSLVTKTIKNRFIPKAIYTAFHEAFGLKKCQESHDIYYRVISDIAKEMNVFLNISPVFSWWDNRLEDEEDDETTDYQHNDNVWRPTFNKRPINKRCEVKRLGANRTLHTFTPTY